MERRMAIKTANFHLRCCGSDHVVVVRRVVLFNSILFLFLFRRKFLFSHFVSVISFGIVSSEHSAAAATVKKERNERSSPVVGGIKMLFPVSAFVKTWRWEMAATRQTLAKVLIRLVCWRSEEAWLLSISLWSGLHSHQFNSSETTTILGEFAQTFKQVRVGWAHTAIVSFWGKMKWLFNRFLHVLRTHHMIMINESRSSVFADNHSTHTLKSDSESLSRSASSSVSSLTLNSSFVPTQKNLSEFLHFLANENTCRRTWKSLVRTAIMTHVMNCTNWHIIVHDNPMLFADWPRL